MPARRADGVQLRPRTVCETRSGATGSSSPASRAPSRGVSRGLLGGLRTPENSPAPTVARAAADVACQNAQSSFRGGHRRCPVTGVGRRSEAGRRPTARVHGDHACAGRHGDGSRPRRSPAERRGRPMATASSWRAPRGYRGPGLGTAAPGRADLLLRSGLGRAPVPWNTVLLRAPVDDNRPAGSAPPFEPAHEPVGDRAMTRTVRAYAERLDIGTAGVTSHVPGVGHVPLVPHPSEAPFDGRTTPTAARTMPPLTDARLQPGVVGAAATRLWTRAAVPGGRHRPATATAAI